MMFSSFRFDVRPKTATLAVLCAAVCGALAAVLGYYYLEHIAIAAVLAVGGVLFVVIGSREQAEKRAAGRELAVITRIADICGEVVEGNFEGPHHSRRRNRAARRSAAPGQRPDRPLR